MSTFHISQEVAILGVSLFVLGLAIGPPLWAPERKMTKTQQLTGKQSGMIRNGHKMLAILMNQSLRSCEYKQRAENISSTQHYMEFCAAQ
jgi:hypothetical protein